MSYDYGSTIIETERDAVMLAVGEFCYAGGCNSSDEIATWIAEEAAVEFSAAIAEIEMRPIPYVDEETTPSITIDTAAYDVTGMIQRIIDAEQRIE